MNPLNYQCLVDEKLSCFRNTQVGEGVKIFPCMKKSSFIDLTGAKFGLWKVLCHEGGGKWLCECHCGTRKIIDGGNLKSGRTKSCRCSSDSRRINSSNKIIVMHDGSLLVPLSNGGTATVDACDLSIVSGRRWCVSSHGYPITRVLENGKSRIRPLHSFLLPRRANLEVDHINGNVLDNRRSNLRLASHRQNLQNQKLSARNTSGAKGVVRRKSKWIAQIKDHGKTIYLGTFASFEMAAQARESAAKKLHGEFFRP